MRRLIEFFNRIGQKRKFVTSGLTTPAEPKPTFDGKHLVRRLGEGIGLASVFWKVTVQDLTPSRALELVLKLLLDIPRQIGFLRFEVLLERRVANAGYSARRT